MSNNRYSSKTGSVQKSSQMLLMFLGLLITQVAQAYTPNLATVPWLGNPALPHQVYSGGSLVLQGVATDLDTGNALCVSSASWDSGSGATYNAGTNGHALEAKHVYIGSVGQPFTATLTVTLCDSTVLTDTMRVVVRADNQEVRVNMAIDKALWYLHKDQRRTTSDGFQSSYWIGYSSYYLSATASTIQAFSINNHRESGNRAEDPYVDTVTRGMRYMLSNSHGTLVAHNIGVGSIYDGNGNGVGLDITQNGHAIYQVGQVIDAIVASGTPNKLAEVGNSHILNKSYINIVQDLLDGYSWAQNPSSGGWLYSYGHRNYNIIDTSSSHWWAIGVLAAETWGLDAPQFVKDRNWTIGIPRVQRNNQPSGCSAGYRSTGLGWDAGRNLTPAALIMMNADDIPKTHERFTCAEKWINAQLNNMKGNFYAMYQTAKAMRTAVDANGNNSPVELLAGTRDWYSEFADYLISTQFSDGSFHSHVGTGGWIVAYSARHMATAWGLVMLSPSLFELPPTASCNASPLIDGTAAIGGNVDFDGSQSAHPDAERAIVSYTWDFADGSPVTTGVNASHSFTDVGIYNVVLTVEDDNGNKDTDTCQIDVRDNDIPPNANPGGPYQFCLGSRYDLDGSASKDLDNQIVSYEWDISSPVNFATVDSNAVSFTAPQAAFPAVGLYDIGLRVTDNDGSNGGIDHTSQSFTTVNIIPADDPSCNQPPVAACQDVTAEAGPLCQVLTADVNNGSSDPDADPLTINQAPSGPYGFGSTPVILSVSDGKLSDSCSAVVNVVDTTPPALTTPADVSVEATGVQTSVAIGSATAADHCDSVVTSDAPGTYPVGVTPVTWTATDPSGNSSTLIQTVTVVDTTAPVVTVPDNVTVEATGSQTSVAIGVATATDAVGVVSIVSDAPASYGLGNTVVTWTACDAAGNCGTAIQTVTVVDTTAPDIANICLAGELWPVNHKLKLSVTGSVSDIVDSNPLLSINVTSNQPLNGSGDGDTDSDWNIVDNNDGSYAVSLRAERAGNLGQRDYLTTITATDASGNVATASCTTIVPHDQGNNKTPGKKK